MDDGIFNFPGVPCSGDSIDRPSSVSDSGVETDLSSLECPGHMFVGILTGAGRFLVTLITGDTAQAPAQEQHSIS